MGTDPRGKAFRDLWDVLDSDSTDTLNSVEFQTFYGMMNLDGNTKVTELEVDAWFTRNEYVVCRPWRYEAILALSERERESKKVVWEFVDSL